MRTLIAISALFFLCFFLKAQSQSPFLVITFCDSCNTTVEPNQNGTPTLIRLNIEKILIVNGGFIILEPPLELLEFVASSFLINERGKKYSLKITKYENNIAFISEKKGVWFKKESTLLINNYYSVINVLCFSSESKRKEFTQILKKPREKP